MRFLFATIVLVGCVALGRPALADDDDEEGPIIYDKTYDVMLADFEDQIVETDHFVINNVILTRVRNDYSDDKGMERLSFAASIKSKSTKNQEFSVMLVGLDDKKTLLWTAKTEDSMYGKNVDSISDQVRVPQGTFKTTVSVWMRVIAVTETK